MTDLDLLVAAGVPVTSAERLLDAIGPGRALASITASELVGAGVRDDVAARVSAAIAIGRRFLDGQDRTLIRTSEDVWHLLRDRVIGLVQEAVWLLPLNIGNELIGEPLEIVRGEPHMVTIHPRELFRPAIRTSASGIVLSHNHPSGDPTPSQQDIELTHRLMAVGELIGIPVVDHVVITPTRHRSISAYLEP